MAELNEHEALIQKLKEIKNFVADTAIYSPWSDSIYP